MIMLVNLSTFALNADVILFDDKDLDNSQHIKVPYHAFGAVAEVAVASKVNRIIIQGTPEYCRDYKDNIEEIFMTNYSNNKITVEIDGGK